MTLVLAASAVLWIGRGVRQGFFMFWETLWPLVLGFALSGAVQAFVPRRAMERVLGDHRPAAVARASGLGMVSSSCSYAATAMAKSLFQKGADFVTSMVFMFASTNLVIELGIVLVVLMGWQFAAAEFVGGAIMIVLLALAGGMVLPVRLTEPARQRQARGPAGSAHDYEAIGGVALAQPRAAWSDAAGYAIADLTMLRRELVIGYAVAGFLTVLVPHGVWNAVFIHGHGLFTSLENVVVGPFIAVISFVCSVGNVPLAAALWSGGISFGGVVSFVFADLITLPLLLVYRKYYGTALTVRLVALFWVVMAGAGLLVEGLFTALRLVPTVRPRTIVATTFSWNYTTVLNIILLGLFALLVWLRRHPSPRPPGPGYDVDVVCGMQLRTADAPAYLQHAGRTHFFCSDRCRDRFEVEPHRFAPT